jgi:hypothetical protein
LIVPGEAGTHGWQGFRQLPPFDFVCGGLLQLVTEFAQCSIAVTRVTRPSS